MAAGQHYYKHLDNESLYKFKVELDMKQVVEMVNKQNYGVHRFISELIDIRKESGYKQDQEFAVELEKLLRRGYF